MIQNHEKLEELIGIKFSDLKLLTRAFIHKSYLNEHKNENIKHNERLEFLGDAVLELAATHYLFDKYPNQDEGKMTSFRSALVKGENLAKVALKLNLGEYLFLSKGEEKSGGRIKQYILANLMEALIGAIYLDNNYEVAEEFIKKFILIHIEKIIEDGEHIDSKSKFQEIAQEKVLMTPAYQMLSSEGPDHNKIFTMGVYLGEELVAKGEGSSKQKAEEKAAENALKKKGWL